MDQALNGVYQEPVKSTQVEEQDIYRYSDKSCREEVGQNENEALAEGDQDKLQHIKPIESEHEVSGLHEDDIDMILEQSENESDCIYEEDCP